MRGSCGKLFKNCEGVSPTFTTDISYVTKIIVTLKKKVHWKEKTKQTGWNWLTLKKKMKKKILSASSPTPFLSSVKMKNKVANNK